MTPPIPTKPSLHDNLINRIRVDIATLKLRTYSQVAGVLQIPSGVFQQLFPSIKLDDRITLIGFNNLVTMLPAQWDRVHTPPSGDAELHGRAFHAPHKLDSYNWLPPPNPLQKATLFPHQLKAAKDIIYRLIIEDKRGILLQAAAGDGKTFIFGQVIRWLIDKDFFKDCMSPWPCLVITKSAQETLVLQTERVMERMFGLQCPRQVYVMSYDALRSGKGISRMIEKTKKHVDGEMRTVYRWIPFLHPKLLVGDEIQATRREDSTQHKVIAAAAECDGGMKFIGSSATAFTRICEAKAITINLGVKVE